MGYSDQEKPKGKLAAIGGVVAVLIVGGIANVIGRTAAREGVDAYDRYDAVSKIDTIEQEGPMAEFFRELRKVDPAKADALKAEIKDAIQSAPSSAEANRRVFEFSRTSMAEFRNAAHLAPDGMVREVAESRLDLLKAMKGQSDLSCARMGESGPWAGMDHTPAITAAMAKASQVTVRAGAEGLRKPTRRPEPTDEQFGNIADGMLKAGVTERELEVLGNGTAGTLSPDRQCNLYIRFYEEALAGEGSAATIMLATMIIQ